MEIYVVKQGDTLERIARQYGISVDEIVNVNQIDPNERLVVGQDLVILIPDLRHIVTEGETLDSIARQYNTTVNAILRNNPTISPYNIEAGNVIVLSYKGVEPTRQVVVNGYTYPEIGRDRLIKILPYLSFLTIFTYGFTNNGDLIEPNDGELIELALDYGVAPVMLISTLTSGGSFSNALGATLLSDEELQTRLINNIIENMVSKGYRGLDIDFEYLSVEYRENYIKFVSRLTAELNKKGLFTMVALAPKTSSTQPGLLYESHDYKGLGGAANFTLLMTYEWGYTYSAPMAVAPLPNVERVISYGVSEIPSQKVLMGIPLYGYNWNIPFVRGTKAKSLSPVEAVDLAREQRADIEYDDLQQAPFFYYTDEGQEHVVWFENCRSIVAKLGLIERYKIAGCSLWNITREFPQVYAIINSMYDIAQVV